MDAVIIWSAIGAVGSVSAVVVAAWAASESRSSAQEANAAAKTLAVIERDRRHDELKPEFEITCTTSQRDWALLCIVLTGGGIEALDSVTVTILDEPGREGWRKYVPNQVTQEEVAAHVWGPWAFLAEDEITDQAVSPKESRPRPFSRVSGNNWYVFGLNWSRPGRWSSTTLEDWHRAYEDKPLRLLLTCHRDGYEPWLIQRDIKVEQVAGA